MDQQLERPQVQLYKLVYRDKGVDVIDTKRRAESFDALLQDPGKYLPKDRVNIFATPAECFEGKRENENGKLVERFMCVQKHVPFDIDDIDTTKKEETVAAIRKALGISEEHGYAISSGHGIQIFIGLKTPITDIAFFKQNKTTYNNWCDKIDLELKAAGLLGHADKSVFKNTQILRIPGTINHKPNKPAVDAHYINGSLKAPDMDFFKPLPEKTSDSISKRGYEKIYTAIDTKAVLEGCLFLKHVKEAPAEIDEPTWYAALGILSFLPGGNELCHDYSKGHPKYAYAETQNKIGQVKSNQSGPRLCSSINLLSDKCKKCPHFSNTATPITLAGPEHIATETVGFRKVVHNEDGSLAQKRPVDYADLLKAYKRDHSFFLINQQLAVYNGFYWELKKPHHAKAYAMAKIKNPESRKNERAEFLDQILSSKEVPVSWLLEDGHDGYVNFKNGVLNLKTGEMLPHNKKYRFFNMFPYEYKEAPCDIDKYLEDIFVNDPDALEFFWRYLGSCFDPSGQTRKSLFLIGIPNTGKSTALKIFETIFPKEVTSRMRIGAMVQESSFRFGAKDLYKKFLNISDEGIPAGSVDMGSVKACISGSAIPHEIKKGDLFYFDCRAKMIFAGNNMVKMKDSALDIKRKIEVLYFDTVLKNTDSRVQDVYIPQARDGMAYKAIQKYMQMYQEQRETGYWDLKVTPEMEVNKNNMLVIGDIALEFFEDVEKSNDPEAFVTVKELYDRYKYYCQDNGIREFKSKVAFGYEVTKKFPHVRRATRYIDKQSTKVLLGIRFKETAEKELF